MKHLIQKGQSLSNIEKSIIAELKGKELWGDIALTEEEYELLLEDDELCDEFIEELLDLY